MTNVDKLRHAYARWHDSRGQDETVWLDLTADDFKLRSLGDGRPGVEFTKKRSGREELKQYLAGLKADWEMIYYRNDEFIEHGDRIVAVGECSWTSKHTGKTVVSPTVGLWRFRDGMVIEYFEFFDTAAAMAAAKKD